VNANVLVTGAQGFIGRHVCAELARHNGARVTQATRETDERHLRGLLLDADVVVHLAGANRPTDPADFTRINVDLTRTVCDTLASARRGGLVILASSTQAGNGTAYGESKLDAERVVETYAGSGGRAVVFRFPNVFGKWAKPRYNSVVATFADAVAKGLPYEVHDPGRPVTLLHVADAVAAIVRCIESMPEAGEIAWPEVGPAHTVTLQDLVTLLTSFRDARSNWHLPEVSQPFVRALHSTYLSYLPTTEFAYDLVARSDHRGVLAEFVKAGGLGQIFVSRTKPGVTRGNHWHETKVEKFLVVAGDAIIRFRPVLGDACLEYPVSGTQLRVVDIPPGYVHSIENVGSDELITLFWANEPFDPDRPDTYASEVLRAR
jgi:UDP-2-acetamido-2,6-beta-L-arabino-hexul-4-ose reductase